MRRGEHANGGDGTKGPRALPPSQMSGGCTTPTRSPSMLPRRTEQKDIMAKPDLEDVVELDEDIDDLEEDLDVEEVELTRRRTPSATTRTSSWRTRPTRKLPVAVVRPAEEEDDEIPDADDVEASLDVILKERLVVEDEVEDDEGVEVDDRGEGTERVLPKQADEFVCNSCFLVKNASQLADAKKGLCRDCV